MSTLDHRINPEYMWLVIMKFGKLLLLMFK